MRTIELKFDFCLTKILEFIDSKRGKGEDVSVIALQMPEGLQSHAFDVAQYLERRGRVSVIVMADAVYGGCCVDDFLARKVGATVLVHLGHHSVVPGKKSVGLDVLRLRGLDILFIPIDIPFDPTGLLHVIRHFSARDDRIILATTGQFANSLQLVPNMLAGFHIELASVPPLPPGVILGCTAPHIENLAGLQNVVIFVGDGRFQLESVLLANPGIELFRFDPFTEKFTSERLDVSGMVKSTQKESKVADASFDKRVGIIVGTMGRQGSLSVAEALQSKFEEKGYRTFIFLLSDVSPAILGLIPLRVFVQVACPRLSMDWPSSFGQRVLSVEEVQSFLDGKEQSHFQMSNWAEDGPLSVIRNNDF